MTHKGGNHRSRVNHVSGEKLSTKSCARMQSFSHHKQIIAEETASSLELSHGTITFPTIFSHHYQLVPDRADIPAYRIRT